MELIYGNKFHIYKVEIRYPIFFRDYLRFKPSYLLRFSLI